MNFYHAQLMDHYRNPRNKGVLEYPSFTSQEDNPLCGDSITIQALIEHQIVVQIAFTGFGCVLSQASASLLTEPVVGISIQSCLQITADDLVAWTGISVGPTRLKCVLLSLRALHKGIDSFMNA